MNDFLLKIRFHSGWGSRGRPFGQLSFYRVGGKKTIEKSLELYKKTFVTPGIWPNIPRKLSQKYIFRPISPSQGNLIWETAFAFAKTVRINSNGGLP
jgi:hypothetical protein